MKCIIPGSLPPPKKPGDVGSQSTKERSTKAYTVTVAGSAEAPAPLVWHQKFKTPLVCKPSTHRKTANFGIGMGWFGGAWESFSEEVRRILKTYKLKKYKN